MEIDLKLDNLQTPVVPRVAVKACVFPFKRFPMVYPVLNAEMKSTGKTLAFGDTFAEAYPKALQAAGQVFGATMLVDDCGKYTEALRAAFKAAGLQIVTDYAKAAFVVSVTFGRRARRIARKCVRVSKTCITSPFAALAIAQSLKENPAFSLVALSEVHGNTRRAKRLPS